MTIETVGSFLPPEKLIDARRDFESGLIDRKRLTEIEDGAVRAFVERQIECGLPFVTSGELRRKHWAYDFWFGLDGISCERVDSGHLYQSIETSTDHIRISHRIGFNPSHSFFSDFAFLFDCVAGRAACRQTLPSPANLLLEIICLSDGHPENVYQSVEFLIKDIAQAYFRTILRLHEMGCMSVQFDDTAFGLMCDDNFTKRLLQGGVDLLELHRQIIEVVNASVNGLPDDMEISIYLSGGDDVVPEWEYIPYPDNIMPTALSSLKVDKFFIPFNLGDDYAIEILRHIPDGKKVVIGLGEAHSPFPDDNALIADMLHKIYRYIDSSRLAVSPRTGFKLSSYSRRGLTCEDQWRKLTELTAVS